MNFKLFICIKILYFSYLKNKNYFSFENFHFENLKGRMGWGYYRRWGHT
jgi:hypothetical protein